MITWNGNTATLQLYRKPPCILRQEQGKERSIEHSAIFTAEFIQLFLDELELNIHLYIQQPISHCTV